MRPFLLRSHRILNLNLSRSAVDALLPDLLPQAAEGHRMAAERMR